MTWRVSWRVYNHDVETICSLDSLDVVLQIIQTSAWECWAVRAEVSLLMCWWESLYRLRFWRKLLQQEADGTFDLFTSTKGQWAAPVRTSQRAFRAWNILKPCFYSPFTFVLLCKILAQVGLISTWSNQVLGCNVPLNQHALAHWRK